MILFLIGRILYAIPMIMFGAFHFVPASVENMASKVPIPFGIFWVYFTGLALIASGIGIIFKLRKFGKISSFLLGVMLLLFAFMIHLPEFMSAQGVGKITVQISIMKDIALAGSAFVISSFFKSKEN